MSIKSCEYLITGGTGSLGNALTRRLLSEPYTRGIRIYSRDEWKQWEMRRRIEAEFPGAPVSYLLGDVRDVDRLARAMAGADFVVNAAALKHVSACENDPEEAVKTNVMGARNVFAAALDTLPLRVMQVSTDKAVNPINLYGATKMVAEKLIINANNYSGGKDRPEFIAVRYGNVIASRGSVVPLFREQAKTGKFTLTHSEMTRFWITLEEVVEFLLARLFHAEVGTISVPDMRSVRITDLIEAIAIEAGVRETCIVNEVGMRDGEKLHECLISPDEAARYTYRDIVHFVSVIQRYPIEDRVVFHEPRYSNTNGAYLTVEEIVKLLKGIPR